MGTDRRTKLAGKPAANPSKNLAKSHEMLLEKPPRKASEMVLEMGPEKHLRNCHKQEPNLLVSGHDSKPAKPSSTAIGSTDPSRPILCSPRFCGRPVKPFPALLRKLFKCFSPRIPPHSSADFGVVLECFWSAFGGSFRGSFWGSFRTRS